MLEVDTDCSWMGSAYMREHRQYENCCRGSLYFDRIRGVR